MYVWLHVEILYIVCGYLGARAKIIRLGMKTEQLYQPNNVDHRARRERTRQLRKELTV